MPNREKYQFNFAWKSPYGHVIKLVDRLAVKPGLVLDFGCGYGPVAEPFAERGFKYIGFDIEDGALEDLERRGFDSHQLDLKDLSQLEEQVPDLVHGREVAVVLLLDVLEHLPSTRDFLRSLQVTLNTLGQPLLIVTLPNVGHADIGAKLAFGRFDYTSTGLLDSTHLSFFTEKRMLIEFMKLGWVQVEQNDFLLSESDQHFPAQHPALVSQAPLGKLLGHLRTQADESSHVNQFVRAFALTHATLDGHREEAPTCFLSILVRTQGLRPANLREALTCLAAQTCYDFEVKLLVHSESQRMRAGVQAIADEFHPRFASRIDVIQITGGGERGRPLNAGLDLANSEYVAFLDDDDWVTSDWVQTFKDASERFPGQIVRSVTVDQQVQRIEGKGARGSYLVRTGLHPKHAREFDFMRHLHANQTPICSFAVPKAAIDAFNLRFNEHLPVTEDWDFLLRAAQIAGVADTGKITSIYHRWVCGEGSSGLVEGAVWEGIRTSILHRLDQSPLLLPTNSATALAKLWASAAKNTGFELENARLISRIQELEEAVARAKRETDQAKQASESARAIAEGFERSRVWRATLPLRWILSQLRSIGALLERKR